jgi:hypothetical protein
MVTSTSPDSVNRLRYHGGVSTRQHAVPGPAAPDVPEPSLAERARTLVSVARIGSLSTHSRKFAGFPFGSLMPYAADDLGRPVLFISSMAMHTQNLHQDARASLLITQPDSFGDPLGAARVTLLGTAAEVPAAEVRDLYLSRHENAKYWKEIHRLRVSQAGGIECLLHRRIRCDGVGPGWGLHQCPPRHMNADHPDALLLIAHRFAGEPATEASVTAVDRLGFHLRLKTDDRVHGRRVAFLPRGKE